MNHSWTVRFKEPGWGAGTLTLDNGQVRGADSRFRYSGAFSKIGNVLVAPNVLIQRKGSCGPHVFEAASDVYDAICLYLTGTIQSERGRAIGAIGGTVHQLSAILTQQTK